VRPQTLEGRVAAFGGRTIAAAFHAFVSVECIGGGALNIDSPLKFFRITGSLSSFLDNAPTYVIFFELAGASRAVSSDSLNGVATVTGSIPVRDLLAVSCGAIFMGAMTYIGNGSNFLVKSIAEHRGVKMPGFFGYMVWSISI
jgi:Na+/H+ antiporter NhaD/arsenite permease-like protein